MQNPQMCNSLQLNKIGLNTELGAVEYSPTRPTSFQYTRRAAVGLSSSEVTYYGAVFGTNMPPLVRISLPGRLPWPEKFEPSDDIERPRAGPPFEFWNEDWRGESGIHPEYLRGLRFSPDLSGQPGDETEPISNFGRESDSSVGLGWHGDWATALLEKQDRGQPLGERIEVVWHGETWGAQVRLRDLKVTEVDADTYEDVENLELDDPRGISDYTVQATILRVFVKSEEFVRLEQQPVVQEEEEDDSEESDEDDEDM
ncbi:hypothetical protein B0H19DRAFT_387664 [Mycena capillaripes]|nr:hypothetical protein B0H19DRAFT_387664 [Mycena capillaripes]